LLVILTLTQRGAPTTDNLQRAANVSCFFINSPLKYAFFFPAYDTRTAIDFASGITVGVQNYSHFVRVSCTHAEKWRVIDFPAQRLTIPGKRLTAKNARLRAVDKVFDVGAKRRKVLNPVCLKLRATAMPCVCCAGLNSLVQLIRVPILHSVLICGVFNCT
jgi:hypothetical protein